MTALVIGGTQGFGKEISQILLNLGYELITVGRSKSPFPQQAHYICDIGNLKKWKKTIDNIVSRTPSIDLVIFVPGYARAKKPSDISIEDWYEHINKNLLYVSLGLEVFKKHLSSNAKIATIGSQWSAKVGMEYLIPYTVSKHALNALTKDFAQRNTSIKTNHYCVPTMKTPQYLEVNRSFTEQKISYSIKKIADPANVALSFINHLIQTKETGKTFIINQNYSVKYVNTI